jgi:outer membrane lipoprotein SlyB
MNTYPLRKVPSRIATAPTFGNRLRNSKALLPTLAVMCITVLAMGAALLMTGSRAEPEVAQAVANAVVPAAEYSGNQPLVTPAPAVAPVAVIAPKTVAPRPVIYAANSNAQPTYNPPVVAAAAPVCGSCGTVVAVTAVQRSVATSGVGAVAGGVLGGVLGNQVGKGSGRTIATVVGAVGGGFAGNEVEKNVQTKTVYNIRVRMDDGRIRNFERANAFAVGSLVRVESNSLRLDDGGG